MDTFKAAQEKTTVSEGTELGAVQPDKVSYGPKPSTISPCTLSSKPAATSKQSTSSTEAEKKASEGTELGAGATSKPATSSTEADKKVSEGTELGAGSTSKQSTSSTEADKKARQGTRLGATKPAKVSSKPGLSKPATSSTEAEKKIEQRLFSSQEIARRIGNKLGAKNAIIVLDCHSQELLEIIKIHFELKDFDIQSEIKTEEGLLSEVEINKLYYIKFGLYDEAIKADLQAFYKHYNKVTTYNSVVMCGMVPIIKRQDNVSIQAHLQLELIYKWAKEAKPRPSVPELVKVLDSLDCKKLSWYMLVNIGNTLRRVLGYNDTVRQYMRGRRAECEFDTHDIELSRAEWSNIDSNNSVNKTSYRSCRIKSCDKETRPSFRVGLINNKYVVTDSTQSDCTVSGGHAHTKSVLHYWLFDYSTFEYMSLLTESKDSVDSWRSGREYVSINIMYDPDHDDQLHTDL